MSCLRLLVMMRIGNVPHEFLGGKYIEWSQGCLQDCVHNYFSGSPVLGHERIKFEKTFNALGLDLIAGVEIRWTDNLIDHLRLINDDTVVCVFHHTAFLECQRSTYVSSLRASLPG